MSPTRSLLAAMVLLGAIGPAAGQHVRREQDAAFNGVRARQVMSLHDIEARIVPRMGGASYLGPEFEPGQATYRLKFMRAGSVIWIDVDGRTGQVIGRSGD